MKTVKIGVSKMTPPAVEQMVNDLIAHATGNADFPNPDPSLVDLQALADDGQAILDSVSMAKDDLAMKRTQRDEKFMEVRDAITKFALWATVKCNGDRVKLQSLGLDVRTSNPVGPLAAPENLRSYPGELEGTIKLVWNPVYGRPDYFAECASSVSGPWTMVYTGRAASATCGDLTPGAEYFFRVRANGAAGFGPYSDITKRRAA